MKVILHHGFWLCLIVCCNCTGSTSKTFRFTDVEKSKVAPMDTSRFSALYHNLYNVSDKVAQWTSINFKSYLGRILHNSMQEKLPENSEHLSRTIVKLNSNFIRSLEDSKPQLQTTNPFTQFADTSRIYVKNVSGIFLSFNVTYEFSFGSYNCNDATKTNGKSIILDTSASCMQIQVGYIHMGSCFAPTLQPNSKSSSLRYTAHQTVDQTDNENLKSEHVESISENYVSESSIPLDVSNLATVRNRPTSIESNNLFVTITVNIPLASSSIKSTLYQDIQFNLTRSVQSGLFNKTLQHNAEIFNETAFSYATLKVFNFVSTDDGLNSFPTCSPTSPSDVSSNSAGGISSILSAEWFPIVLGIVIGMSAWLSCIGYLYWRQRPSRISTKLSRHSHQSITFEKGSHFDEYSKYYISSEEKVNEVDPVLMLHERDDGLPPHDTSPFRLEKTTTSENHHPISKPRSDNFHRSLNQGRSSTILNQPSAKKMLVHLSRPQSVPLDSSGNEPSLATTAVSSDSFDQIHSIEKEAIESRHLSVESLNSFGLHKVSSSSDILDHQLIADISFDGIEPSSSTTLSSNPPIMSISEINLQKHLYCSSDDESDSQLHSKNCNQIQQFSLLNNFVTV